MPRAEARTVSGSIRGGAMNRGFIVLLNGCSSSGKTSLAHALQAAAPHLQLVHVSLDAFRGMEPDGFWAPERKTEWPARVAALCHAINAATREYTRHGQNVILDHVLSPEAWRHLEADLANERMYLVRVECSPDIVEIREASRPDRSVGLARSQWDTIHAGREYDLTADTSNASAQSLAQAVLQWIELHPHPVELAARSTRCCTSK